MVLKNMSFIEELQKKEGSLVVGIYSDGSFPEATNVIDRMLSGEVSSAVKKLNFSGKLRETATFLSRVDNFNTVLMVGLGEPGKSLSVKQTQLLGSTIYSRLSRLDTCVSVILPEETVNASVYLAFGALMRSWVFDKYKPSKSKDIKLDTLNICTKDVEASNRRYNALKNVAEGAFLTRSVVSEPSNVIYPETLAQITKNELEPLGVSVEILTKEEMQKLGMNALLGVAQGSVHDPRLVVLKWNGDPTKASQSVSIIGKGVTFDSGGISIKPDNGMHEMTTDMAGSGVVLGLFKAVALNKLPVNITGVMPLVENMPSGTAQRPGDIVTSMSGKTIEILSTDAEGRLILADAITYAKEKLGANVLIDLATLTGSVVVALGHEFAGLYSNNESMADKLIAASRLTGEELWRMPLSDHFDKAIDSDVADMQNLSKPGTGAGNVTAAQFLKRFVGESAWAHIDIAGVAITSDDSLFMCGKGATGFGVYLLHELLIELSQNKTIA